MFKKLLKHDFRSIKKTLGLPALVALAMAVIVSIIGMTIIKSTMNSDSESGLGLFIIAALLLYFSFIALFVVLIGTQVMIYVNFYKNLMTDEGYLTFTLPVKPKQIIFSKMTNGVIWSVITGVASFLAILVVLIVAVLMFPEMATPDTSVPIETTTTVWSVLNVIIGIFYLIMSYFASQLLYFVIIFLSANNSKGTNKPVKIVLSIFGVNIGISIISGIVSLIIEGIAEIIAQANYEIVNFITLCINLIIVSALAVGMYFLLKYLMEKKLNLA